MDIFRVIREIRMRQPHAVDREVGSNDEQLTNAHTHTHTHIHTHMHSYTLSTHTHTHAHVHTHT